jgi:hypothetical protein
MAVPPVILDRQARRCCHAAAARVVRNRYRVAVFSPDAVFYFMARKVRRYRRP